MRPAGLMQQFRIDAYGLGCRASQTLAFFVLSVHVCGGPGDGGGNCQIAMVSADFNDIGYTVVAGYLGRRGFLA